ncbi:TauD-domain-containing protein [Exidia glandulosa HHB12029]|uniref:TauD-domain-containing protein n=1 Tax=Exidia glandulosa HHB12029 TaxID=1314781 RepID=A0A165Q6V0_EXIGL|nr:TauD-domain-containing protein [Exidia glandulosa HHB12029]
MATQTAVETVAEKVHALTLNSSTTQTKRPTGPAPEAPEGVAYPLYYPTFSHDEKFPPTELFEHNDPGLRADKAKPNLLKGAKTTDLSPYIGTEIEGVQLSQLTKEGLDELALYTAERKVLVFRDQDFKDLGVDKQVEFAQHFGPIQLHPTSGNVKNYPEFHIVYRDPSHNRFADYRGNTNSVLGWHSDVSYEKQPPGTTLFFMLQQPDVQGSGDTLFVSQVEAYNRLSDEFKKRLEGLRALHSAVKQAEFSKSHNGPVRREPVETEHPLVRQHPVTGEKALYINEGFVRHIVGYKKEESDYLLKFLFDHIAKGADFQIRASYKPGTVVVWDNRVTAHSAIPDFSTTHIRHAARLTPQAEVPIPA